MDKVYKCHTICEGVAEAEVIISKDDIMFYLVEPEEGKMVERGHDIEGKIIANKIVIFPSGKGSAVVQADGIYQLQQKDTAPVGMIIERAETVLVSSVIIFNIPTVDKVDPQFYNDIKNGDRIRLDANNGVITILD